MLATSARMVPDIALAWFELPSALNRICSPSFFTSTLGSAERASVPSGPLMEIWPEAMFSSTPFGSGTGYFAILDMAISIGCGCWASSSNDAEHFAADAVGARLAVGHDAARGGQDRDPEPVHDPRDVVASLVDAQPRLGDALQPLDHRLAGVVLQCDGELLVPAALAHREVLDVALVLQHLRDGRLELGGGHHRFHVPDHLGVADADQHVGDRICHAHRALLIALPARLDHAWDFALQRQIAQLVAAEAGLALSAARPAGQRAAGAQSHRRSLARQLLELGAGLLARFVGGARVLDDVDQRRAPGLELLDGLAALLVAQYECELGHAGSFSA